MTDSDVLTAGLIFGGDGDDTIAIWRSNGSADNLLIQTGAGKDIVTFQDYRLGASTIDLGDGDDRVTIWAAQPDGLNIVLGAGQDTVASVRAARIGGPVTIRDFATGDGGDKLELTEFLNDVLRGWDGTANPFGSAGYLRLVQSSTDTVLQIDSDGAIGSGATWTPLMTLQSVDATALTASNLDGFSPNGAMLVGQTVKGTPGNDVLAGSADADMIVGGSGNDLINGGAGPDQIDGGVGNDTIQGGPGADVIEGGDGDDRIEDVGGSDRLSGGAGNDTFVISRGNNDTVENLTIDAGSGNDVVWYGLNRAGSTSINLGEGNDLLNLATVQSDGMRVTLGAGQDTIALGLQLARYTDLGRDLVITDFAAGTAGDKINLTDLLLGATGWNGSTNPFGAAGYLRLIQSGADTLLQYDDDGAQGTNFAFTTLLRFANSTASQLTAANFGGWAPSIVTPTQAATAYVTAPASVLEGADASFAVTVTLKNVAVANGTVTISLFPNQTSATAGSDFSLAGYQTTFSVVLSPAHDYVIGPDIIQLFNDQVTEGTESIALRISAPGQIFDTGTDQKIIQVALIDNDVVGTQDADLLVGTAHRDELMGYAGNDTLVGGAAADTLTGGRGADIFQGSRADLNGDRITDLAVGDRIEVTDVALANASYTRAGSSLALGAGTTLDIGTSNPHLVLAAGASGTDLIAANHWTGLGDFNGDGHSDILWRNDSGAVSDWTVTGNVVSDQLHTGAYDGFAPVAWSIVESLDMNGDGLSDLLWRNANGALSVWDGAASGFQGGSYDTSVPTDWTVAAAGDFNGDGMDDILWRQDAGALSYWTSTGSGFQKGAYNNTGVPTDWKVEGAGDFNGDGKSDILWRNDAGAVSTWLATDGGFQIGSYTNGGVPTAWHVAGLADFNGDGRDDILWRNDGGALSTWLSNGTGFDMDKLNDTVPTDWKIAATGDYNNDGKADILWRNDNGAVSMWNTNGDATGFVKAIGDTHVPTDWHIVAHDFF